MEEVDIAILGSGIAGLGAALKARENNAFAVIFEARSSAGGLLDNFEINGFRFDNAVHLSFAKEEKVRSIFDKTKYFTHPSDSYCFDEKYWLKHPIQNNLFPLPADEKLALIESYLVRPNELTSENYEDWLRHQYGDAIAERYPIRYTRKYWRTEPSCLSTIWIGNRMRRSELKEVLFGSFTDNTPNTYYTQEMRYPEKGGFKSFIQPLIDNSNIRFDHEVTHIDIASRVLHFRNGLLVKYNTLVSTLPLPLIVNIILDCPLDILDAANSLKATSIDLISIGFNRNLIDRLWFYIYDEDILASRAYSPSVKSPNNAPPNNSSLQFEIYSRDVDSSYTPEELKKNTIQALEKMNIATTNDILFVDHRRLKYGNVIFDIGMEKHRKKTLDYLSKNQVKSCGRFGEWDYLWSNQSFMSGYSSLF